MAAPGPITAFTEAIEKAVRNGQKAHLDPDVLRAVIESDAYAMLLDQRRQAFISSWAGSKGEKPPRKKASASSSENIGSNGVPNGSSGASPGTIHPDVHDAAEVLALEAARRLIRRGKQEKPSPSTSLKHRRLPNRSQPQPRQSRTS